LADKKSPGQSADCGGALVSPQLLTPEVIAAVEAAVRTACRGSGCSRFQQGGKLDTAEDRLAYAISELAKLTSLGRQSIYDAISSGHLIARKVGRRTFVLRSDAERWLTGAPIMRSAARSGGVDSARAGPEQERWFEPSARGRALTPHENRPDNAGLAENVLTPPGPPCDGGVDCRVHAQEYSQQNSDFFSKRARSSTACAEPAGGVDGGASANLMPAGSARGARFEDAADQERCLAAFPPRVVADV
jgi:hypothetical protein